MSQLFCIVPLIFLVVGIIYLFYRFDKKEDEILSRFVERSMNDKN